MVTVNLVAALFVLPGLMSKTRSRPPPSTVTAPPLVLTMFRLPPVSRMAKAPPALVPRLVPGRVIW